MLPKVAAAIIKHLKPISTKSADASVNTKVKEKASDGQRKQDQKKEKHGDPGDPQKSGAKLQVIAGGRRDATSAPQGSQKTAPSLGFGKFFSDFVHKLFAQESYEKTSGQARTEASKGKKGGLIDRKVM